MSDIQDAEYTPKRQALVERDFMPAMTITDARKRMADLVAFVKETMTKEIDFGAIPGTGDKPTLLKPGAEKLCTLFGLHIEDPEIVDQVEDWTGKNFGGEPFFYYKVRQRLTRNGVTIASQIGSCNSREKKYRYRQGDRKCPHCLKPTVFKSKKDGGWFCWAKKGGCGAQFDAGDKAIESQVVGNVPNPDIADQVNTILKMAQKRALVAATLVAVNASQFFTQDIEDVAIAEETSAVPEAGGNGHDAEAPMDKPPVPRLVSATNAKTLRDWCKSVGSTEADVVVEFTNGQKHLAEELTVDEAKTLVAKLREIYQEQTDRITQRTKQKAAQEAQVAGIE